jgi:hypothetical protein
MKEEKNTECKGQKTSVQRHQAPEKQHAFFSLLFAVSQHRAPRLHIDCRAGFDQTTLFPYYAPLARSSRPYYGGAYAATGAAARPFSMPAAGASTLW